MYKLVSCGVNVGPGASRLRYAQKDAQDVYTLFTGSTGPINPRDASCLLGPAATRASVLTTLRNLAHTPMTAFIFYFSGHGNDQGLLTSDGLLPFAKLVPALQNIDAAYTMIILDACCAASYLAYTEYPEISVGGWNTATQEAWLETLARATPGSRLIFSTGPNRDAAEDLVRENGQFTAAYLSALSQAKGDIVHEGYSWVSDQRAFDSACYIMRKHFGSNQQPIARQLSGNLPLILSTAGYAP